MSEQNKRKESFLPCPFCGCPNVETSKAKMTGYYTAYCESCGARTDILLRNQIADAWNRRAQQEQADPQPNERLLTESDIRAMVGDVIIVVSSSNSGKTTVRKVIVDLFDYKDDHALIVWKFNIRNDTRYLSAMEKHCLLLPFSELGYTWLAYAHEPKGDHHA